ncbi:MAG: AraC family transcriptional regulator [Pseudomonadales bacterium]
MHSTDPNSQHATPDTMASYSYAFVSALESKGVDPKAVFEQAGIPFKLTSNPLNRYSEESVSRLFSASIKATNDPYIGLDVGKMMQPGNLHALGFGLLASTSLRDFFERISKYFFIASKAAEYGYEVTDDECILYASHINPALCYQAEDAWLALIMRYLNFLFQTEVAPRWIEFRRPCPEKGDQPYIDYFDCPVRFGCRDVKIAFDAKLLDKPLHGANSEMAAYNDQIVMQYIEKLNKDDIVNQVRIAIIETLKNSTPSLISIASQLHISSQSLKLKLARRDTHFQSLLEETRKDLCMSYIRQKNLNITQIALLLGFSNSSNFTRAFKRWTGQSPKDFRRSC